MRYTLSINAVKCKEWQINLAQGALMDLINQASSWARACLVDEEVYYWVSRNKVIEEIPVAYSKPDTVYRALKSLADKGIIIHIKEGKKDLIKLTEKGMTWNVKGTTQGDAKLGNKSDESDNSEINPTQLGNKSEKEADNSEINPPYKSTTNKSTTDKNTGDSDSKNEVAVTDEKSSIANDLFNTWLKLSGQRIKSTKKRISHIKARLEDGFTIEQITGVMQYVATDSWHVENGYNTIELAVRSTDQFEKKLIKAAAVNNQTQNKGNHHDKSQSPANSKQAKLAALRARANGNAGNQQSDGMRTVS